MGRKEVLAERRAFEEFYYNCKLETPEEVEKYFEVYTKLIWNHHLPGLVYDCYCDHTTLNEEGGGTMIGGVRVTEEHTIPSFGTKPFSTTHFTDIFAVGNKDDGYMFGQITTHEGILSKNGASMDGMGDDTKFGFGSEYIFCECYVNKVNGRWCITDEFLSGPNEFNRRLKANCRPYLKTVVDDIQGPFPENPYKKDEECECKCCCEGEAPCDESEEEEI